MTEWIPLVTRKESPFWVSLVCLGGERKFFQNALGWPYAIKNYKYENFTHSIAVPDAIELQHHIDEEALSGDFFVKYLDRCVSCTANLDSVSNELRHRINDGMTVNEMADSLERFSNAVCEAMPFLASLVLVQDRLEAALRLQTGSALGEDPKSPRVTEVLGTCVIAPKDTNVVLESRSLLNLAAALETTGCQSYDLEGGSEAVLNRLKTRCPQFLSLLDKHVDRYGWLRTFTYLGEPFSIDELLLRVKTALERGDCRARLHASEARHRNDLEQARVKAIEWFGEGPLFSLLQLAGEYLYWRFERVDVHFRSEVHIRLLEMAIAAAANLTREELVHCTYPEIIEWLRGRGDIPERTTIEERMTQGFDCFVENGAFSIRKRQPIHDEHTEDTTLFTLPLSGTTACPGKASGTARLLFSAEDIHKLNEGDILVTTMTTPDLMLAIEKCSAIVTDEGGLLCHAAIISRELQIPCVIGTGGATKAVRDGDLIVVDAKTHEGTVRREVEQSYV